MRERGTWAGTRLIDAALVDALFQSQIPVDATESPDRRDAFYNEHPIGTPDLPGGYSYGFWLPHRATSFGGTASRTEAAAMRGAFGTTVVVARSLDLVLASVHASSEHAGETITAASLDRFADAVVAP